jgi:hypothetical protein
MIKLISGDRRAVFRDRTWFGPGEFVSHRADFYSISVTSKGIEIPPLESRDLHFLLNFPDPGIYVLVSVP